MYKKHVNNTVASSSTSSGIFESLFDRKKNSEQQCCKQKIHNSSQEAQLRVHQNINKISNGNYESLSDRKTIPNNGAVNNNS